jgi:hypothetical protein
VIDLDLIDSLYEHHAGPIHYFGDADLSYVNTILKAVPGMISELKAAREVVEAARDLGIPSHSSSDLREAVKRYDEAGW